MANRLLGAPPCASCSPWGETTKPHTSRNRLSKMAYWADFMAVAEGLGARARGASQSSNATEEPARAPAWARNSQVRELAPTFRVERAAFFLANVIAPRATPGKGRPALGFGSGI